MRHLFIYAFTASCLAVAPRQAAAQSGGFPIQTTARTQFVFQNGEVLRRDGNQTSALTQNVKLPSGIKINYKNGIVEMPADKVNPQGKKLTLREGDYVRTDGGIVFATPASAAAARGIAATAPSAKFDTYTQRGPDYTAPATQIALLTKKIDLLTQKIQLLGQGRTDLPDTKAIDDQLTQLDARLTAPK